MTLDEIGNDRLRSYFNEEQNEKHEEYVNKAFCDDDKEKEISRLLRIHWYEILSDQNTSEKKLDHILHRIHYKISTGRAERKERKVIRFIKWSKRIAGIIILPIILFWGIKSYIGTNAANENLLEINAPTWTRVRFSLPDGTQGWLNSNSSLRYNPTFSDGRSVSLSGEAFFDVAKNMRKPFVVSANEVTVRVIGTKFNIASYANEKDIEVVLEEGKLIFYGSGLSKSYTMSPHDLIIYDKFRKEISAAVVEPHKYSSWTEGKLVFRNDPLDVIARKLERWYNVAVEVNGNSQRDPRLRATFVDETLEEVLSLLKSSLSIDYTIDARSINPDDTYARKKVLITVNPTTP